MIPTRRSLLTGIGAIAGAALLPCQAWAGKRDIAIGLEVYTVGGELLKDFDGTLAAIAAAGYREIEIPSLYGRSVPVWQAALKQHGLVCDSMHIAATGFGPDMASLENKPEEVLGQARDMGVTYIPCGLPPMPIAKRPTLDDLKKDFGGAFERFFASMTVADWRWVADFLNEKGVLAKARGLTLAYHNHSAEFRPGDGTTGFDELMRLLDPKLVTMELDCGWAIAGGRDPVALLNAHPGRFELLHLKDLHRPAEATYVNKMEAADIGAGVVDWPALLAAARKAGVRHTYVEQEPPYTRSPLAIAADAYRYLAAVPRR